MMNKSRRMKGAAWPTISFLWLAVLIILWPSSGVRAQTFRGIILGTVTDQTMGPIPGATVTVKNQATGLARTVPTDNQGQYNVPELPIGTYSVTVEKEGFGAATQADVSVTEWVNVQIRADVFNILNHPNFANPFLPAFIADPGIHGFKVAGNREVGALSYPITATGDVGVGNPFLGGGGPRGIQLAVKFSF